RGFENQRYRASGLNLVVAAIVLGNTAYLERRVQALRASGKDVGDRLLPHLSPLGCEYINLTGDYALTSRARVRVSPVNQSGPDRQQSVATDPPETARTV